MAVCLALNLFDFAHSVLARPARGRVRASPGGFLRAAGHLPPEIIPPGSRAPAPVSIHLNWNKAFLQRNFTDELTGI